MRYRRLLAAVLPISTLIACAPSDQHVIGDHSIPVNATYIGVAEGYTYLGGVNLGDDLHLWVIPYNSRYVREHLAKGPFVIAIKAWDLKYSGTRIIRLAPNDAYVRVDNGQPVKAMGYQVVNSFASAHCHPIGASGDVSGVSLRKDIEPENFPLKTSSACIEIFFDSPLITPDASLIWGMPKIVDGERIIPAREISFIKHYGR